MVEIILNIVYQEIMNVDKLKIFQAGNQSKIILLSVECAYKCIKNYNYTKEMIELKKILNKYKKIWKILNAK